MSVAISAESVSKKFLISKNRPRTLRESFVRRISGQQGKRRVLWALRGVSFEVQRGQTLGIMGHNGAGKSTLLRLLCGVGLPTSGSIQRYGAVSGLLELGTGFHPLMTGRENLRTAGIINGLTKRQVENLEQEIISFAELEEFIDEPVRTYSTGMYLRLAFSSAIQMNPEVLIIDEVLTVGDDSFRQKCLSRLTQFRNSGKTLIITSHDLDQIQTMCDEALVLEEGELMLRSDPESAIIHYHELMRKRTDKRAAQISRGPMLVQQPGEGTRTGSQEVFVQAVRINDHKGISGDHLLAGPELEIDIETGWIEPVKDFGMMFGIFTEKETKCFETRITSVRSLIGPFEEPPVIICRIPHLPLLPGRYFANVGLFPCDWEFTYDYHWQMHEFQVVGYIPNTSGNVLMKPIWSAEKPTRTNSGV